MQLSEIRSRFSTRTIKGVRNRNIIMAYLFILPTILGILIFSAGPVLVTFGLSFFRWNVIEPASFIGVQNFKVVFKDPIVSISFLNTIRFVLVGTTLQIIIGLLLAIGVSSIRHNGVKVFFRSVFFVPLLISSAAISVAMSYLFHREFGLVNFYLDKIGIDALPWLTSSRYSLTTAIIVFLWQQVGFTFILFTGALGNIPQEIQDAADVDGAYGLTRLFNITIPLISPSLFFAAVTGVIGALQMFEIPYILTRGGPGDSSRTVVMTIYEAAFKNLEIGYGSTITVFLFLLILLATYIQFRYSQKWVYYQ